MTTELKKLFEPVQVGNMWLKNRVVYPPMVVNYSDPVGGVTPQLIEYYVETARAGMGLLTLEATMVMESQRVLSGAIGIHTTPMVPGLNAIVDAIRTEVPDPPKLSIQLIAVGRETEPEFTGTEIVGASDKPSILHPVMKGTCITRNLRDGAPRALSTEEVVELEDRFADAALRASMAGFDAVELHAAHGYMLAQFLSPFTNNREDEYGKDRTLLIHNIIDKIHARLGPDFPIIVRFSGDEYIPGAATLEDRRELAKKLQSWGVVGISVTGGIYESAPYIVAPSGLGVGVHIENASRIKEVVDIPVWGVGRIIDPRLAEKYLQEGKVDLVAMGRPFFADREILKKGMEGRYSEIRKCIGCNTCVLRIFGQKKCKCAINPAPGHHLGEVAFEESCRRPAEKVKKVLVIGGGPGGMEAARIAAQRGHHVTLWEKEGSLGGNVRAAAAVSFKKNFTDFIDFHVNELKRLGVKTELNKEATEKDIVDFKPDVAIIATGAECILPDIPIEKPDMAKRASDVLLGKESVGENVVVVGGGLVGVDTAIFLAEAGKKVTIVTRRTSEFSPTTGLAPDTDGLTRIYILFMKMPGLDIKIVDKSHYHRVTSEGLVVLDADQKEKLIPGDTVVFALGFTPNNHLKEALMGKIPEVYTLGDSREPRKIFDAVHEGAGIGRQI